MWTPKIKAYKKDTPINFPVACETKYDGEFVYWNGQALLNKRNSHKSTISKLPKREVYGELYYGEGKWFYSEIHSHSGIQNKVILFDTGNYGKQPYIERRKEVEQYKDYGVEVTPMTICENRTELDRTFEDIVKKGYEGCVVKPLDSLTDSSWVKMKKEYTATLLVKGLRKGKTMPTITLGSKDHIYCSCTLSGWNAVIDMLNAEKLERGIDKWIIGEDKENYLVDSNIKLEVKHNGLILPNKKLRHPRIKRIRSAENEINIQQGD